MECFSSGDEACGETPKNLACYVEEDNFSPGFLFLCSDCDRKVYERQREQFDDEECKLGALAAATRSIYEYDENGFLIFDPIKIIPFPRWKPTYRGQRDLYAERMGY